MGRLKKRLSKRKTLKLKYKIERKVKESNRKKRKEQKGKSNKPAKKDLRMPNSWPYKEQEIQEAEEKMARLKEEKERQKEKRRKEMEKKRKQLQQQQQQQQQQQTDMVGGRLSLQDVMNAQARESEFEANKALAEQAEEDDVNARSRISQQALVRELKKTMELSDVLLEVLDARDPLGCRCKALETMVEADVNKKLILVLNKIDLVPKEAAQQWLAHLRKTHPTIAFKASTQQGGYVKGSKVHASLASSELLQSTQSIGSGTLIQLIKNYSRSHDLKKSIVVGVFGYPNVGKSSLINSLKRSKAVGVSSCPGFTRKVTEIHLDKHIKLLDCPGVVMDSDAAQSSQVILRNAVAVEKVEDPIRVVEAIAERCSLQALCMHYNVALVPAVNAFLVHLARTRGKLSRGGKHDLDAAARVVLGDWNVGKIPFYTLPPQAPQQQPEETAAVVGGWAKEFDIEALLREEERELGNDAFASGANSKFISMAPGEAGSFALDQFDREDDDMEGDSDEEGDDDEEDEGDEDEEDEGDEDEEELE